MFFFYKFALHNFIAMKLDWSNWNSRPTKDSFFFAADCVYMRRDNNWLWSDAGCSGGINQRYSYACQYSKTMHSHNPQCAHPLLEVV